MTTILEREKALGRPLSHTVNTAIAGIVAVREMLPMAEDVNISDAESILEDIGIPDALKELLCNRHLANLNDNMQEKNGLNAKIKDWLTENDPKGALKEAIMMR